jgi:Holliday junction resolvase
MAMTPERKVKNDVTNILKRYRAYYFYPPSNGFGRMGIPDIIVCFHGRFIAIECKAGANQATALQLREINNIIEAGGVALIISEKNIGTLELELTLIEQEHTNATQDNTVAAT